MKTSTRLKLLVTAGAASIAASLLFVAADPTAPQYEITVYDSHPAAFWLLVLVGLLLGQVVIFESAILDERHRYWKWGFALLVAANAVLLLLPALRYYLYARGDMLTFIGMARQIETLGVVPRRNYYPNIHLLTVSLSYATGLRITTLVNLVPPLFSILYMVSLYELLDALFTDQRKTLFVLPFGALLLFTSENLLFSPNVSAFMMVPFVLYLLFRILESRSPTRFQIPFVVVVVALVFYHPITTIFLVGIFVLLKGTVVAKHRLGERSVSRESTLLVTASLAFVVFFSWYYSFESIIGSTTLIVYALLGLSQGSPQFAQLTSVLGRATPKLSDIAIVGVYRYGLFAPIVAMGSVFITYQVYLHLTEQRRYDFVQAFLAAVFVSFTAAGVVAFFVDVTIGSGRFWRYVRFSGSILIGLGVYSLFRRVGFETARQYLRPVVYLSFFVFAFLSMFMLYGSPLSNNNNLQITEAQIEGMDWLLEHRDESLLIDELGIRQYRVYTFKPRTEARATNIRKHNMLPPPHFAYDNVSALNQPPEALPQDRYLVITSLGRVKNPRFYPNYRRYWRHTPSDFRELERDPSISHLYDDGEMDAYLVRNVGASANDSSTTAGG